MTKFRKKFQTTEEVTREILSIYHFGQAYKSTQLEIQEQLDARVFSFFREVSPSGRKRYANYFSAYARGVARALYEKHYDYLEFCYIVDGFLYSTSRETKKRSTDELYNTNRGLELHDAPANFYYKDSNTSY